MLSKGNLIILFFKSCLGLGKSLNEMDEGTCTYRSDHFLLLCKPLLLLLFLVTLYFYNLLCFEYCCIQ